MNFTDDSSVPFFFSAFFILMWLGVTTLLSWKSGWFKLMRRYPDQDETSVLVLRNQSGSMGGVSMRNILQLEVCPSGLRISIFRIFGPFL